MTGAVGNFILKYKQGIFFNENRISKPDFDIPGGKKSVWDSWIILRAESGPSPTVRNILVCLDSFNQGLVFKVCLFFILSPHLGFWLNLPLFLAQEKYAKNTFSAIGPGYS